MQFTPDWEQTRLCVRSLLWAGNELVMHSPVPELHMPNLPQAGNKLGRCNLVSGLHMPSSFQASRTHLAGSRRAPASSPGMASKTLRTGAGHRPAIEDPCSKVLFKLMPLNEL